MNPSKPLETKPHPSDRDESRDDSPRLRLNRNAVRTLRVKSRVKTGNWPFTGSVHGCDPTSPF